MEDPGVKTFNIYRDKPNHIIVTEGNDTGLRPVDFVTSIEAVSVGSAVTDWIRRDLDPDTVVTSVYASAPDENGHYKVEYYL